MSGNFLHYFAEAGNTKVLGNLMAEALRPNYKKSQESGLISEKFEVTQNEFGDTFLHVFAFKHSLNDLFRQIDKRETEMADEMRGSTEAPDEQNEESSTLTHENIQKAKETLIECLEIQNNKGYTFVAAALTNVEDEHEEKRNIEALKHMTIVFGEEVVSRVCRKTDFGGNSLAHLAVRKSLKLFMEFILPKITEPHNILNKYGYNPLHLAVQTSNRKMARCITQQKNFDVNKPMRNGETALHIAAQLGQPDMLGDLIEQRGDLSVRDEEDGHTPLHDCLQQLFYESEGKEEKLGIFVNVWDTVVEKAVTWWCQKQGRKEPANGSEEYLELQCKAIYYLRSFIRNNDGMSVLQYAADRGLVKCVQVMLCTKDVFVVQSPIERNEIHEIDTTNLCPEYHVDKKALYLANELNNLNDKENSKLDFLHTLAEVKPPNKAGEILDSIPMRKLTAMEWKVTAIIHLLWLFLHYLLMILVTFDAITAWSLWSTVLGLIVLFYATVITSSHIVVKVVRIWNIKSFIKDEMEHNNETQVIILIIVFSILDVIYSELPFLIEILFTAFGWAVYVPKMVNFDRSDYDWIDGVFLLFGWLMLLIPMTSLHFRVYRLISVLRYIVLNDIVPWTMIYFPISFGFASAIQLELNQLPRNSTCEEPVGFINESAIFELIFMTSGLDTDLKHVSSLACLFEENSKDVTVIVSLIALYAVISMVVLLNMLIAIMSSTVTKALQDKGWGQYQVSCVH